MNEWERDRGRRGSAGPGIREREERKKGKSPINVKVLRITFRFGNLVTPSLRCALHGRLQAIGRHRPVSDTKSLRATRRLTPWQGVSGSRSASLLFLHLRTEVIVVHTGLHASTRITLHIPQLVVIALALIAPALRAQYQERDLPRWMTSIAAEPTAEAPRPQHYWGPNWMAPDEYLRELSRIERMTEDVEDTKGNRLQVAYPWIPIGPARATTIWSERESVHGRARCIGWFLDGGAWRRLAGFSTGGLWERLAGGWFPIGNALPSPSVGSVSLRHGVDGRRVIYAGTGDWGVFSGTGLYQSESGGRSWRRISLLDGSSPVTPGAITAILARTVTTFNETRDTMYLASDQGFFRSSNFGYAWQRIPVAPASPAFGIYNLVVDPTNFRTLYAALPMSGVHVSTDAGSTWRQINNGLPTGRQWGTTLALAISPSHPQTLYCAILDSVNSGLGIFRTTNGGTSWSPAGNASHINGGQGFHTNVIAVHPTDPNRVYAGGVGFVRSEDGGRSWRDIDGGHADFTVITFDPRNSNTMLLGNDGGVYERDDAANIADSRTELFFGGAPFQQDALDIAATNPDLMFIGMQDNGSVVATASDGSTPSGRRFRGGDGGNIVHIDPVDANRFYFNEWSGPSPRVRSRDGGTGSEVINNGLLEVPNYTPIRQNRLSRILYTVDTLYLYYSDNGGDSWRRATNLSLDYPPNSKGAGIGVTTVSGVGEVVYMTFSGAAARQIRVAEGTPGSLFLRASTLPGGEVVQGIIPDRYDPNVTYGLTQESPFTLYRTPDRGLSGWTSMSGATGVADSSLPRARVNDVSSMPGNPNDIVVATDMGVFRTRNGGTTWRRYQTGLPIVPVKNVIPYTRGGATFLVASTYGRGTYRRQLGEDDYTFAPTTSSVVGNYTRYRCPDSLQYICRIFFDVASLRGIIGSPLPEPPGCFLVASLPGIIERSLDGGRSWAGVKTPLQGKILGIAPVDDLIAIAVSEFGELIRTQDMGVSWENMASPLTTPLRSAHFRDNLNGVAVGDSGGLLTTKDGGLSWTQGTLGIPFNAPPDLLQVLMMPDGVTGWIVGNDMATKPPTPFTARTTDAGATWDLFTDFPGLVPSSIAFATDGSGWGLVPGEGVIKSLDGGATWQSTAPTGGAELLDILPIDAMTVLACGADGAIIGSADGGKTWSAETADGIDRFHAIARNDGGIVIAGDTTLLALNGPGAVREWIDIPNGRTPPASTPIIDQTGTLRVSPNPFVDHLSIAVEPSAGPTRLVVIDRLGRTVRTIAVEAERAIINWDGRDDAGQEVPSGVYLVRAETGKWPAVARAIRIK